VSTSSRIWIRKWNLVVGTLDLGELAMEFEVKKTLKPEPNTVSINVYNLNKNHQAFLAKPSRFGTTLPVRLEAGYEGPGVEQIYFGEVRAAWTTYEGEGDHVTHLEAGDGEASKKARVHVTVGAGAPPDQALRAIVKALQEKGVKSGNVENAVRVLKSRGKALFPSGGVISGNASREMDDFCRAAGLEWSIQDGALQILERGKATPDTALLLSAGTGLVGSTTVDTKGLVNATVKIVPGLRPGRLVVFKTETLSGNYRIQETTYRGQTHGDDWVAEIVCKAY
jgi:hypothetical protein